MLRTSTPPPSAASLRAHLQPFLPGSPHGISAATYASIKATGFDRSGLDDLVAGLKTGKGAIPLAKLHAVAACRKVHGEYVLSDLELVHKHTVRGSGASTIGLAFVAHAIAKMMPQSSAITWHAALTRAVGSPAALVQFVHDLADHHGASPQPEVWRHLLWIVEQSSARLASVLCRRCHQAPQFHHRTCKRSCSAADCGRCPPCTMTAPPSRSVKRKSVSPLPAPCQSKQPRLAMTSAVLPVDLMPRGVAPSLAMVSSASPLPGWFAPEPAAVVRSPASCGAVLPLAVGGSTFTGSLLPDIGAGSAAALLGPGLLPDGLTDLPSFDFADCDSEFGDFLLAPPVDRSMSDASMSDDDLIHLILSSTEDTVAAPQLHL